MSDKTYEPVAVSRRIDAPAERIFQVLSDPAKHLELDGSGMLRGAVAPRPISAVGDVFVMRMYFSEIGDYEMNNHIVVFEKDRRIGWEPESGRGHPAAEDETAETRWGHRWIYELAPEGPGATLVTELYDCSKAPADERIGMEDGRVWLESMAATLERLEAVCRQEDRPDGG
jgi:hypothetical protein